MTIGDFLFITFFTYTVVIRSINLEISFSTDPCLVDGPTIRHPRILRDWGNVGRTGQSERKSLKRQGNERERPKYSILPREPLARTVAGEFYHCRRPGLISGSCGGSEGRYYHRLPDGHPVVRFARYRQRSTEGSEMDGKTRDHRRLNGICIMIFVSWVLVE